MCRLRDVEKALQDLGDRLTAVATPKDIERVLRRFVEPVDTSKAPLAVHRAEIDQAFEGAEAGPTTHCGEGGKRYRSGLV